MKYLRNFLKNEITGWKKWELIWMLTTCIIIALVSICWGDSLMGIISAVTGILYVEFAGKGKLSAYIFGLINCVLYAIISYKASLYGETMLNVIYYIPMQFVGFYVWNKNMNDETKEVRKRYMKWKGRIICLISVAAATLVYGLFLSYIGDLMPFVDAFTTMSSVIAMIVSVKMFAEQWWIWFVVDVVSVYMWWGAFCAGSDSIATLLMWVVYIANAVILTVKWGKEADKE